MSTIIGVVIPGTLKNKESINVWGKIREKRWDGMVYLGETGGKKRYEKKEFCRPLGIVLKNQG